MNMGSFAGGLATGLQNGMDIRDRLDERKEKKEEKARFDELMGSFQQELAGKLKGGSAAVQQEPQDGATTAAQPAVYQPPPSGMGDGASQTSGNTTFKTKEFVDGEYVTINDSFRAYDDPSQSAADWVGLMGNSRYSGVRNAQSVEEAIAAQGKSGYATDPQYSAKLRAMQPKTQEQAAFFEARKQELLAGGASPVLAEVGARQSALETGWGKSAPNNNYFGIKGKGGARSGGVRAQQASAPQQGNQPPASDFDAFTQNADARELADFTLNWQLKAATNPKFAKQIAPALDALKGLGMKRWMDTNPYDPTSLEAARYYGQGQALFGEMQDPEKLVRLRQAEDSNKIAARTERRNEARLGIAMRTEQRNQERHRLGLQTDASKEERERAKEKREQSKWARQETMDALDNLQKALTDGNLSAAETIALKNLGVEIKQSGVRENYQHPATKANLGSVPVYKGKLKDGTPFEGTQYDLAKFQGAEEAKDNPWRFFQATEEGYGTKTTTIKAAGTDAQGRPVVYDVPPSPLPPSGLSINPGMGAAQPQAQPSAQAQQQPAQDGFVWDKKAKTVTLPNGKTLQDGFKFKANGVAYRVDAATQQIVPIEN